MPTVSHNERTWQQNAAEFGALTKQGVDFRLAALVACSVMEDANHGKRNERNVSKASASAFARKAGTSAPRILRHLHAWDSVRGLPKSTKLMPNDVDGLDLTGHEAAFEKAFAEITKAKPPGGRPRDTAPEVPDKVIDRHGAGPVVEKLSPANRAAMAKALAESHPQEMAEAMLDNPEAARASDDIRMRRIVGGQAISEAPQHQKERAERMAAARDAASTAMEETDLVHHEATLMLWAARSRLLTAVEAYERNPFMTEDQEKEHNQALAECARLLQILQSPADQWNNSDREFLDSLGIEDIDA